jgi:hypothetical protein
MQLPNWQRNFELQHLKNFIAGVLRQNLSKSGRALYKKKSFYGCGKLLKMREVKSRSDNTNTATWLIA